MHRSVRRLGRLVLWIVLLAATVWGSAALWFDGPASLAALFAAAFALAVVALLIILWPRRRAYAAILVLFAVLLGWWLSLEPSNDRDWQPDVAQLPAAEIRGDRLVLRNVRDFNYRSETDYTEHWETRRYDLSKLRGLDLFVIYWGSPSIAHTILSWDFGDGQHLAIS